MGIGLIRYRVCIAFFMLIGFFFMFVGAQSCIQAMNYGKQPASAEGTIVDVVSRDVGIDESEYVYDYRVSFHDEFGREYRFDAPAPGRSADMTKIGTMTTVRYYPEHPDKGAIADVSPTPSVDFGFIPIGIGLVVFVVFGCFMVRSFRAPVDET